MIRYGAQRARPNQGLGASGLRDTEPKCKSIYLCVSVCLSIYLPIIYLSEVRPLFKKGNTTEFSNYRPISLLTSFSKIIEKIIYKRLCSYLNDNNILVDDQYGFREKLSTETVIHTLLNNVLSSLDRRNLVGGLFCD